MTQEKRKQAESREKGRPEPNAGSQVPDKEGMIMIRRVIDADNSCLFNSVAHALRHHHPEFLRQPQKMRKIIAETVSQDPETYCAAVLERSNAEYQNWIQRSESWGGQVECSILSSYFAVEIFTVDIQTLQNYRYGQDQFENR